MKKRNEQKIKAIFLSNLHNPRVHILKKEVVVNLSHLYSYFSF